METIYSRTLEENAEEQNCADTSNTDEQNATRQLSVPMAFWEALENDDLDFVKTITDEVLHAANNHGPPLLHVAVQNNSIQVCCYFIEKGFEVNGRDSQGDSPLHLAMCDEVSMQIFQSLLLAQADVNCVNSRNETPLHVAAFNGSVEKIGVLLKQKVINVHLRDFEMNNALHVLLTSGEATEGELVLGTNLLLKSGLNINAQNKYKQTALIIAVEFDHMEAAALLIKSNADLLVKDNKGDNFLQKLQWLDDMSVDSGLQVCWEIPRDTTRSLLVQQNICGVSPFHWIVTRCSLDQIKQCLEFGADVNQTDYLGQSPIHLLSKEDIFEFLLHSGADVKLVDINGKSVIHKVTNTRLLKIILDNGGTSLINVRDKCGITPLHEFVKPMISNQDMLKILIDNGAEINAVDNHGSSLLHYAVWYSMPDIVDFLTTTGIDSTFRDAKGCLAVDALVDCDSVSLAPLFPTFASLLECNRVVSEEDSDESGEDSESSDSDATYHDICCDKQTEIKADNDENVEHYGKAESKLPEGVSTYETKNGKITLQHKNGKINLLSVDDYCKNKGFPTDNDVHQFLEAESVRVSVSELLRDPLRGAVPDCDEAMKIKENIISLMENILREVGKYDERFSSSLLHTGSSSEGTRVCQPNEFDFICFLDRFGEICEIQENNVFQLNGFSQAKLRLNADRTESYVEFFNWDNTLNSDLVRERFHQLVKAAFHQGSIWRETSLYLDIVSDLADKPTLNAEVQWVGCRYKGLEISIDIVPAIYRKGYWPSIADTQSCTLMTRAINEAGCALLLQSPDSIPDKFIDHKDSVMRISCAPAEVALFKGMPRSLKDSYALAKILLRSDVCPSRHFEGEIFNKQLSASNYISSYMLKNCLLHALSESPNVMLEPAPASNTFIKEWTLKIFQHLRTSAENSKLVPYFFQQTDIFSFEYKQLSTMDEKMTVNLDKRSNFRRLYFTNLIINILEKLVICELETLVQ